MPPTPPPASWRANVGAVGKRTPGWSRPLSMTLVGQPSYMSAGGVCALRLAARCGGSIAVREPLKRRLARWRFVAPGTRRAAPGGVQARFYNPRACASKRFTALHGGSNALRRASDAPNGGSRRLEREKRRAWTRFDAIGLAGKGKEPILVVKVPTGLPTTGLGGPRGRPASGADTSIEQPFHVSGKVFSTGDTPRWPRWRGAMPPSGTGQPAARRRPRGPAASRRGQGRAGGRGIPGRRPPRGGSRRGGGPGRRRPSEGAREPDSAGRWRPHAAGIVPRVAVRDEHPPATFSPRRH